MTEATERTFFKPFLLAYAAAAAFAGILVWFAGHRGVFLLDQSILFDGAWRITQGQVPYRDYVSAFPPVPFFIQSLFFRLAGVNISATVLSAAAVNAIAAICVLWLIRRFVPDQPLVAFAGALLTGVWFQAPFGTLWLEQSAFFFNMLALVLLVKCLSSFDSAAARYRFAAGVLLSVSMLCKQNAGGEFVPFALVAAAIPVWPDRMKAIRAMSHVLAGLLLGAAVFALWLWIYASPANFWTQYVVMARQIGSDRVSLIGLLLVLSPLSMTWWLVIFALGLFASAFSASRVESMPRRDRAMILWMMVGLAVYQNLFKMHTDNEIENAMPFLGLLYGLSFAIFWKYAVIPETRREEWVKKAFLFGLGCLVLGYPFYAGMSNVWSRNVQQFESAVFDQPVHAPGMSRVVWGNPTRYGRQSVIELKDFEALNAWLTEVGVNFFVFPDSTMLYGLHGRVSPQPYLYFSPGHSFKIEELSEVDERVVEALQKNNVQALVLEKDSWVFNHNLWQHMPKLKGWIEGDFEKVRDFGLYDVRLSKHFQQSRTSSQ